MLPNDTDYLARKEHFEQLQREAEYDRLIRLAKLQKPKPQNVRQKLSGWIGGQLIRIGLKLQQDQSKSMELAENTD